MWSSRDCYCTGGKSIYWGGWCPRLTSGDLAIWPAATVSTLDDHYIDVESETGVVPATDFIFGPLGDVLTNALVAAAMVTPGIESALGDHGVESRRWQSRERAAVRSVQFRQVQQPADPDRRHSRRCGGSGLNDAARRLFLVPLAHVIKLHASGGATHTVEVDVAGQRRFLPIAPGASVVLAASAIEITRLALHSFPTALMGRNLMVHVRSDFTVRIKRAALPPVPSEVQTAALLVRGIVPSGRFHVQVTASTHSHGSDELLFRMIPDLDLLQAQLANDDPNWIAITFRGIGETRGDRDYSCAKRQQQLD